MAGEAHFMRDHHHRFAFFFRQLLHDAQHFADQFRIERADVGSSNGKRQVPSPARAQ